MIANSRTRSDWCFCIINKNNRILDNFFDRIKTGACLIILNFNIRTLHNCTDFVKITFCIHEKNLTTYFIPFLFLPLSLSFNFCAFCPLLIGCLYAVFLLTVCYLSGFLCLLRQVSAFVGGGRIAPDEERLVLLKPVVYLSFTYSVLRGLVYIYAIQFTITLIWKKMKNKLHKILNMIKKWTWNV